MSPGALRTTGAALTLASLAVMTVGLVGMVQRLQERFEDRPPVRWYVNPIQDIEFSYEGAPVRIETVGAGETRAVRVQWGDESFRLPVTGLEDVRLPQLVAHKEWLRVLEMARDDQGLSVDEAIRSDSGMHRLVIVAKDEPADPFRELSRAQRRDQTRFTFLHFDDEQGLVESASRFDELEQGTWRFAAAMELVSARPNMIDDGFSALGWSWGAARVGVLGLVVGLALVGASFVRREPPGKSQSPKMG